MSQFIGKKMNSIEIKVPNGEKIYGVITEIKQSDLYPNSLSIKIECPEHKVWAEDGKRQFVKFTYYSFPMNWSAKNKSGRLYQALMGKLPTGDIDWETVLLNREVTVVFNDDVDEATGVSKGQRISSISKWEGVSSTGKQEKEQFDDETPF